jgi:hypothetical protein
MLEIILIMIMSGHAGTVAERKGYPGVLFRVLFVVAWFVAEVVGFVIGSILFRSQLMAYLTALLFAIVTATGFNAVVKLLPPTANRPRSLKEEEDEALRKARRGSRKKRSRDRESEDDDRVREGRRQADTGEEGPDWARRAIRRRRERD